MSQNGASGDEEGTYGLGEGTPTTCHALHLLPESGVECSPSAQSPHSTSSGSSYAVHSGSRVPLDVWGGRKERGTYLFFLRRYPCITTSIIADIAPKLEAGVRSCVGWRRCSLESLRGGQAGGRAGRSEEVESGQATAGRWAPGLSTGSSQLRRGTRANERVDSTSRYHIAPVTITSTSNASRGVNERGEVTYPLTIAIRSQKGPRIPPDP
jgi:hypothetical protein